MCRLFYFIIGIAIVSACTSENKNFEEKLSQLDALVEENPRLVKDSLEKIDPSYLNQKEKAYYYLIKAMAIDKNLLYIDNDSTLIVAEQYYNETADYYNLVRTKYYLAKYLFYQKENEKAYQKFKEAISYYKLCDNKDEHLLGLINYNLGKIQHNLDNIEEAKKYFNICKELFLITKDTISAIHTLKQLSVIYMGEKKYNKANEVLMQALNYFSRIPLNNLNKNIEAKAAILISLSCLNRNKLNYPEAIKLGKESIKLLEDTDKTIYPKYYLNLIKIFEKQGQTDSIYYYSEKMLHNAEKKGQLIDIINSYRILYAIEKQRGNYKNANSFLENYTSLKDSLNEQTNKTKLLELDKKYDIAEKENLLLSARIRYMKNIGITFTLIFLLITLVVYLYASHKKLKKNYKLLNEETTHSAWNFNVAKELTAANHNVYESLVKKIKVYALKKDITKEEFSYALETLIVKQKQEYSNKLITTLTGLDNAFIKMLQKKLPILSIDDQMMAAMLRHKWNLADMGSVFHITMEAIRKRKSRLYFKIKNNYKENNVEEFLANIFVMDQKEEKKTKK